MLNRCARMYSPLLHFAALRSTSLHMCICMSFSFFFYCCLSFFFCPSSSSSPTGASVCPSHVHLYVLLTSLHFTSHVHLYVLLLHFAPLHFAALRSTSHVHVYGLLLLLLLLPLLLLILLLLVILHLGFTHCVCFCSPVSPSTVCVASDACVSFSPYTASYTCGEDIALPLECYVNLRGSYCFTLHPMCCILAQWICRLGH